MSQNESFFFYTEEMSVGYDRKPLIRNIRMEVKKGEILTLIGPNGAGKSTILKSITGQLELIGGCSVLDRRIMQEMSAKELARRLAVVLTERINPELMTCRDVVETGRYPFTGTFGLLGKEDHARVSQALSMVQASDLAERPFSAISDGQRQRILLARAICQEPELIILDEPTSFLDIRHKLEFLSILKRLIREFGTTVIMSLHELDLAERISDRVLCVKGTTIWKSGTPQEIFTTENICTLYDLPQGSYNAAYGCMELPRPQGTADLFVIAGGGSGLPVYRSLARKGLSFAAGILHESDVEYPCALRLASGLVTAPAFEPIGNDQIEEAFRIASSCSKILYLLKETGTMNRGNEVLLERLKTAYPDRILYDPKNL